MQKISRFSCVLFYTLYLIRNFPGHSGQLGILRVIPDGFRGDLKMALLGFRILSGMVRNIPDDPEWIRIVPDLFRTVRTGSGIFRVIPDDQFRAETASFWRTYLRASLLPQEVPRPEQEHHPCCKAPNQ